MRTRRRPCSTRFSTPEHEASTGGRRGRRPPVRIRPQLHLAGLHWPGETGLAGHSDGDAAAHAACDALLSAAGLGDLGGLFGTADPRWAGASGRRPAGGDRPPGARGGLRDRQRGRPGDRQPPQAGAPPHRRPRRRSARPLGAPVSVSATTTDGLGLTGRGEGVAAVATALVVNRSVGVGRL